MLQKKQGFPEDSELVICTVTKVLPHAVFAVLEEYDKSGMIHISEIAPGRIRNIRDYVKEGKTIICKVLDVRTDVNQIDLSLRRVTDAQRRLKADMIKQEQKSEKIIEFVAKKLNRDAKGVYNEVAEKVLKSYDSLNSCFEEVAADKADLVKIGVAENIATELAEVIKQRITPPEVEITGTLIMKTYAPNGIQLIRNALMAAEERGGENAKINYLGAGKYKVIVKAGDYKTAEKIIENTTNAAIGSLSKDKGIAGFEKDR